MPTYAADDWCWPNLVEDHGFLRLQTELYETAFGRWASSLLLSFTALWGLSAAHVVPPIVLALLVASMTWCWFEILGRFLVSLLIAEVTAVALIMSSPLVITDGFFWQPGLLTYVPPLLIAFAGAAATVRWQSPVVAVVAAFLIPAFNESAMTLLLGLLVCIYVLVPQARRLVGPAIIAAAVSSVIVVLAPGNGVRRETLDIGPFWLLPVRALVLHLSVLAQAAPLALFPMFLLGVGLSSVIRIGGRQKVWMLSAFALSYLAVLSPASGVNFIAPRVMPTVVLPMALACLALGVSLGQTRTKVPVLAARALACTLAIAFVLLLGVEGRFQRYRTVFANNVAILEAAPPRSEVILDEPEAPHRGVWRLTTDPTSAINECVARRYDLDSVRLRE